MTRLPAQVGDGGRVIQGYTPSNAGALVYFPVEDIDAALDRANLNLVGCTDPKASNYRSYYVRSDPARCRYARRGER